MLEEFKTEQPEFYEYVISSIEENHKTSHAYLIETNGYKEGEKLVLSFVKFLFCQNLDNSSTKECDTCNICNLIDYNTFPDLKIIRPNGLQIKKEQIKELEDEFKTMPEGHNRIYVIMNADTLNASAANAILKFLEEPSPGIIGIFVTQNRYKMMNTILSRCQILSLKGTQDSFEDNQQNDIAMNFLKLLETKKEHAIAYLYRIFNLKTLKRDELLEIFKIMNQMYEEILNIKCIPSYEEKVFASYTEELKKIADKHTLKELIHAQETIYEGEPRIRANVNLGLFLNQFILQYSNQ